MANVLLLYLTLSLVRYSTDVTGQTTTTISAGEGTCATNNDFIQLLLKQHQQQHQLSEEVARDVRSVRDQHEVINTALANLSTEFQNLKSSLQQLTGSQQQAPQENLPSSLKRSCIPLLIQQRLPHGDPLFFNRSWAEFKVGFNASYGNYWLGNDMLHQLTTDGSYKLRIEFQLTSDEWHWAEYSLFVVHDEATNYRLDVGRFSGTAGDALGYHNGRMFSSWDRDNTNKCGTFGGFWYGNCCNCCVNYHNFFKWYLNSSTSFELQTSRMWLNCR